MLSRTIRPHGRSRKERLEDAFVFNFTEKYTIENRQELDRITEWRTQYPQPEFAYYRQLLAGYAFDGALLAKKITAPTLICAGSDDPLVPIQDIHLLKKTIPKVELKIFAGKHLFFYEHSQEFNQTVLEFLKSNEHQPSNLNERSSMSL